MTNDELLKRSSGRRARILQILRSEQGKVSTRFLCDRTGICMPTISSMLRRMANKGLIVSTQDVSGKKLEWGIMPKGLTLIKDLSSTPTTKVDSRWIPNVWQTAWQS